MCEDGHLDSGEDCDDGNNMNGDGCNNTCLFASGDGAVNRPGETCNPPGSNAGQSNECRANCTFCGDGVLNLGEGCDDGSNTSGDHCSATCQVEQFCGDNIVNAPGETCDPPGSNAGQPNECRADCTFCGDGNEDSGEQCDDGNNTSNHGCSADCKLEGEATCRTPGFWGTHAGTEKDGSHNITQAVIDAAGGTLNVCAENIVNTDLFDAASAVEGICVPFKGSISPQLARQLIAAALTCVISGGGANCAGTPLYATALSSCNAICVNSNDGNNANGPSRAEITSCIAELHCLNNGHLFDSGVCSGNTGCHERVLVNIALGLHFEPPGPAGSSDACNDATDSGMHGHWTG